MIGRTSQSSRLLRTGVLTPAGVLLLLGICWALLLPRAEDSIFARVPALDEAHYLDQASGSGSDLSAGFMSPLYPLLIRMTGSGWSASPEPRLVLSRTEARGIRLFQIACWLAVVLLLHLTARRVLSALPELGKIRPWLAWLPSLLFVFYGPAVILTLTILLEIPLVLLVTLFFYLLTLRLRSPVLALGLGLTLGLAILLRGAVVALLPLAAWILWRRGVSRKQSIGATLVLVLATLMPLMPPMIANSLTEGRLCGPTLNGGINLFIGNSEAANGFYVEPVGGDKRLDPAGTAYLASRLQRDAVSVAAADRIWTSNALRAMAKHPVRTFGLWARKVWLHLQAWEIEQLVPLGRWVRAVPWLKSLVIPYGLLAVLGLLGLALGWRDLAAVRIWLPGLALLVALQSLFFVVTRYRLVLVPLLCLGVMVLAVQLIRRSRLWVVSIPAAVLLWLGLQPWGLEDVRTQWRHLGLASEAQRWAVLGESTAEISYLHRARQLYEEAAEGLSADPAPWLGWAATCQALGKVDEAEKVLEMGLSRVEQDGDLRRQLVAIHLGQERRNEALVQLQGLLGVHPEDADALHNITVLLADMGQPQEALKWARLFRERRPEDPRSALDLGVLLARAGRRDEAAAAFKAGLEGHPGHPALVRNLEILKGRTEQKEK
jgi:tetratricopeptide (TPR) repeat protein